MNIHATLRFAAGLLGLLAALPVPLAAQSYFPPDPEVRRIALTAFQLHDSAGVVIGMLDAGGKRRFVSVGGESYDGRTLFEIGSITKVFTGILLAEMALRGELRLDQPVAELLPDTVRVPSRAGRQITLVDLSTHSSGLPRMPDNFSPADPANPYVDYTADRLYDFLARHEMSRDIGALAEYSNVGVGLLGHALTLRADTSYEALVMARILEPLGMTSTVITIPDSLRDRLAPGHDPFGRRVANWDITALAGAGALRSTADDMLTFLAANLDPPPSLLGRAIQRSHLMHFRRSPTAGTGLGWGIVTTRFGQHRLGHDGGTAGYRAYAMFDPERRVAVVVLTNQASEDAARIGAHLLDSRVPLSMRGIERAFRLMAFTLAGLLVAGVFVAWRRTGASWTRTVIITLLTAVGAFVWLSATSLAAAFGLIRFDTMPPTLGVVLVLVIALAFGLGISRVGARLAGGIPLALLVGVHAFRLPLELMMHRAYEYGLMPIQMSYSGLNFDILTGILAIVVALLVAVGRAGIRIVRTWNLLGVLLLLNIVVIAWLSTPTPMQLFRQQPANTWIARPPYIWLPTVMVAFAILGHIVVWRRLGERAS
jgi:serine-type D-Ala-D-Ala carboxypeptidase/endopeptidase